MQDLRDKLLKAGLVDKKQARKVRTEERRKKKKKKKKKGPEQGPGELDAQRQRYEQKMEQQAAGVRDLQHKLNEEKVEKERLDQIRNLIKTSAEEQILGNDQTFHFVGRDRRIHKLTTKSAIAELLTSGALAIVECDDDPARDYKVVRAAAAERLEELDAERILFWNKPGSGEGDLPPHGAS